MAKEYIEREAAIKAIEDDCLELVYYTREDAIQCVKAIPDADVAPVVHALFVGVHGLLCSRVGSVRRFAVAADNGVLVISSMVLDK